MKDGAGRVTDRRLLRDTRPPSATEQAALDAMPPVETRCSDRLGLAAAEVPGSRLLDRLMLPSLNVRGLRAADVGARRPQRRSRPRPPRRSTSGWPPATTPPGCSTGCASTSRSRATWCWTGSRPRRSGARTAAVARLDARVGYPAARARADLPVVGHLLDLAGRAAGRPAAVLPTLGGVGPAAPLRAPRSPRRR